MDLRFASGKSRISAFLAVIFIALLYLSFATFHGNRHPDPIGTDGFLDSDSAFHHDRDVSGEKYVTLLAPSSPHPWDSGGVDYYFETVMVMAHRLLHHHLTKDPYGRAFLVVATEAIKPKQVAMLTEMGAEVKVVASLPPPSNVDPTQVYDRWKDQYTKLLFWNMTEYQRIVYIDADSMIIKPVYELFDLPVQHSDAGDWLFASVYDAAPKKGFGSYPPGIPPLGPDDKWGHTLFSAGQFVLMPTQQQSEYVFSIYNNPPDVDFRATMEQSFLRYAYRDEGPYPWVRLSQLYNTQYPRAMDLRVSKIVHEKSWVGGPNSVKELMDRWYKGWGDVQGFLGRMRGLQYYKEHLRA
jgi:alpha-N-acetylglucosamine transferase